MAFSALFAGNYIRKNPELCRSYIAWLAASDVGKEGGPIQFNVRATLGTA